MRYVRTVCTRCNDRERGDLDLPVGWAQIGADSHLCPACARLCPFCDGKPSGPMLLLGPRYLSAEPLTPRMAHAECVYWRLCALLDPDYEPGAVGGPARLPVGALEHGPHGNRSRFAQVNDIGECGGPTGETSRG